MTQKQIESLEIFNFAIKNSNGAVVIDRESAIDIKRIIENQVGYIKELLEEIKSLELEHDLIVERILDKLRYLCGLEGNKLVIDKEALNTLERRLKGEE